MGCQYMRSTAELKIVDIIYSGTEVLGVTKFRLLWQNQHFLFQTQCKGAYIQSWGGKQVLWFPRAACWESKKLKCENSRKKRDYSLVDKTLPYSKNPHICPFKSQKTGLWSGRRFLMSSHRSTKILVGTRLSPSLLLKGESLWTTILALPLQWLPQKIWELLA